MAPRAGFCFDSSMDGVIVDSYAGLERHVLSRLGLLTVDGMASLDGGRYRITDKGRRILAWYRGANW